MNVEARRLGRPAKRSSRRASWLLGGQVVIVLFQMHAICVSDSNSCTAYVGTRNNIFLFCSSCTLNVSQAQPLNICGSGSGMRGSAVRESLRDMSGHRKEDGGLVPKYEDDKCEWVDEWKNKKCNYYYLLLLRILPINDTLTF